MTQGGEPCGQQHQLVAQQLHQTVGAAQARCIEVQMPTYALQGADLTQQLHLPALEIRLAFLGAQDRTGMGRQQFGDLIDFGEIVPGDGFGARGEQADHAHTGDG